MTPTESPPNEKPPGGGRWTARWVAVGFVAGGIVGFLVTLIYIYFR